MHQDNLKKIFKDLHRLLIRIGSKNSSDLEVQINETDFYNENSLTNLKTLTYIYMRELSILKCNAQKCNDLVKQLKVNSSLNVIFAMNDLNEEFNKAFKTPINKRSSKYIL
jgi:hypothetical protein